jgi:ankyrin repeat protein
MAASERLRLPHLSFALVAALATATTCGQADSRRCAEYPEGRPPVSSLLAAIRGDDIDAVRRAIACGADPNASDDEKSVLWHAIQHGNAITVRELVKAGADVHHRNPQPDGATMLAAAVDAPGAWVLNILLAAGADPNRRTGYHDFLTPLGRAASAGNQAACEELIRAGADPNSWNLYPSGDYLDAHTGPAAGVGRTPLMMAASRGHVGVVLRLMDLGADPGLKNERGKTAFDLAGEFPNPVPLIQSYIHERILKQQPVDAGRVRK